MPTAVRNRIDALELRAGAGHGRVLVLTTCPLCDESVSMDDQTPCDRHQAIPSSGRRILIRFVAPASNHDEGVSP